MLVLDRSALQWLGVIGLTLVCLALKDNVAVLFTYPAEWQVPLADALNVGMAWLIAHFGPAFRAVSWALDFPVRGVRELLHRIPWPVAIAITVVIAHRASGWSLAAFAGLSMLYMVVIGYWDESMNSLALVLLSVPLAILFGFLLGTAGFFSRRSERMLMPILDLMQTIPAFAYLIPILLLFGFGPVVGLIASLLFAVPPMVRNTIVGLRAVPPEVVESGLMSGATPSQLFFQVQVPTALRQILLGANQTTMAALSMVIIASIIGGTNDIGWEVLSTIRKALFGESLLAGIVIALMAMIIDRITVGLAVRSEQAQVAVAPFHSRHRHLLVALAAIVTLWVAALVIPAFATWPEAWIVSPAKPLNELISYITLNFKSSIETVKTIAFFYLMLPMRIGLAQTVTPFSWGFELTTVHSVAYAVLLTLGALWTWRSWSQAAAVAVALTGIVFYFGLTNLPWPAVIAIIGLTALQVGGTRLALAITAGLLFLLLTGVWPEAVMSIYLCGLAVLICFVVGGVLGTIAAYSDRFSAFLRPINDTLQTMPLFVLLIPVVMFFKLGDFTALLAIVMYAIVPIIRYTEHGLRNLPKEVVEAAQSMGTTPLQMLTQVKLPLALPVIMLGLNQTVLYGISMLVITALVGTNDLGQRVYIGLGDGDFGKGIIAGLGMAILAMTADRIIQAAVRRRQLDLGATL
ncbi:MAG: ABC transporter permease subunit [Hyphomicrobiaceae bacterium]